MSLMSISRFAHGAKNQICMLVRSALMGARRPAAVATRYPRRRRGLRLLFAGLGRGPALGPIERPVPVRQEGLALVIAHRRLVARRLAPHLVDLVEAPAAGRDPGQVGSPERRRLGDLG